MLIRSALPTDAQDLAILGGRLWRETYGGLVPDSNLNMHVSKTFGPKQQAAELADPASRTLIVEERGEILGYALLRPASLPAQERAFQFVNPMEVVRYYLASSIQGTGAAALLMDAVLSQAAASGHDGVWLQVWDQNPRAIRFYAKAGFQDVGETTYRVGEQVDTDRVMVHLLMAHGL